LRDPGFQFAVFVDGFDDEVAALQRFNELHVRDEMEQRLLFIRAHAALVD